MKRLLVLVALFAVGAGASGCDTGYKFATNSPSSGSAGTQLPGGSTTSSTAPAAPCAAADLAASGGRRQDPNDAGGAVGDVVITDTTVEACELEGVPSIALLSPQGRNLDVKVAAPVTPAMSPVKLAARRKTSAELVFSWENWCSAAPGALKLEIVLASGRGTLTAPLDSKLGQYVPTCDRPGTPSTLRVQYAYVNDGPSNPSDA